MTKMKDFVCARCNSPSRRLTGDVNRALRTGRPQYCSKECLRAAFSEARRFLPERGTPEFTAHKSGYDKARRARLGDFLREKKRAAYCAALAVDEATVRAKQKAYRDAHIEQHNEYCRQPEYKKEKRTYDRELRARGFGEFADAHVLLMEIDEEIRARAARDEIYAANGTQNKALTRRREYEAAHRI